MDDATKKWLCAGHSAEEQASLLKQVADDEAQQKEFVLHLGAIGVI
jgi:hypothetical protein